MPELLRPGVLAIQAQERIVQGQPAGPAARAMADAPVLANPWPIAGAADGRQVLDLAW